jgi:hypothetical protein
MRHESVLSSTDTQLRPFLPHVVGPGDIQLAIRSSDDFALRGQDMQAVQLEVHRHNLAVQALYNGMHWERRDQFFLMSRHLKLTP